MCWVYVDCLVGRCCFVYRMNPKFLLKDEQKFVLKFVALKMKPTFRHYVSYLDP